MASDHKYFERYEVSSYAKQQKKNVYGLFNFQEYKLEENVVDYDAAASGNEDELAKLIVICMYLTMVQKPCEVIKEKTMWNLSTEDQKVIEAILLAIVNDDQLTRSRLNDVLQDVQGIPCKYIKYFKIFNKN